MPFYIFKNPKTGEEKEVLQGMNDDHSHVDEDGLQWERIFLSPNSSIDTKIDCFSKKEFSDKTAKNGMSLGDMWDLSKEMSRKREKVLGNDPVKDKYFKNYKKQRKGRSHGEDASKNSSIS